MGPRAVLGMLAKRKFMFLGKLKSCLSISIVRLVIGLGPHRHLDHLFEPARCSNPVM
jgi:hypothetical protein